MSLRTLLIVNPASRGGATGKRFHAVEPGIRAVLGDIEIAWTEHRGHAASLARKAAAHVDRVLAAGGDGTAHEVAEGLLESGEAGRVQMGLLPLGTGGDLMRTLGMPSDLAGALDRIRAGATRTIDAAQIHYCDVTGTERAGWLVNEISAGFAGLVAATVDAGGKWMGGTLSFAQATVRAIIEHPTLTGRVSIDGEVVHDGAFVLASACNGQYFGGGMKIAPHALPDDGLLDCLVIPGMSRTQLLPKLGRLYTGTHLEVPGVISRRGRVFEVASSAGPVPFEVDGEPLGGLPIRAESVPGALTIVGAVAP